MATRKARHGWCHVSGVAVPQLPAAEGNAELAAPSSTSAHLVLVKMAHEVDSSQS